MAFEMREFRYAGDLMRYVNDNNIPQANMEKIAYDPERSIWTLFFWGVEGVTYPPSPGFYKASDGPKNW